MRKTCNGEYLLIGRRFGHQYEPGPAVFRVAASHDPEGE